jgi:hypothetical protein
MACEHKPSNKINPVIPQDFTFPAHDPHEEGTLEEGLDAALELHNREETLLARAVKAEAGCAEMRGALDGLIIQAQALNNCDEAACYWCNRKAAGCKLSPMLERAKAALSSSCGKALLGRVKHLEQAEGLLERVLSGESPCDKCTVPHTTCLERCFNRVLYDAIDAYLNPNEPKEGESRG